MTSGSSAVARDWLDAADERIQRRTEMTVDRLLDAGDDAIERRLRCLDREWDVEQAMEFQLGLTSTLGLMLSLTRGRRWLLLPAATSALQMVRAATGLSPALPLMRALGYRTSSEIDRERVALKAARGDFRRL